MTDHFDQSDFAGGVDRDGLPVNSQLTPEGRRAVLAEMEEGRRKAEAKDWRNQALVDAQKRVARLEKLYVGRDGTSHSSVTMRAFARAVADSVKRALDPLERRIAELERQLAEGGSLKYLGVYQRAQPYQKGAVVTHDGSAWAAIRGVAEAEPPGTSDAWQLMVKGNR